MKRREFITLLGGVTLSCHHGVQDLRNSQAASRRSPLSTLPHLG